MERRTRKFDNMKDFLNYVRNPLEEAEVNNIYRMNNIKKEILEVSYDYVYSLIDNIHSTYLGEEFMKSEEDIKNHFSWCIKKVNDDFLKEGIDYTQNSDIEDYFYNFFSVSFYKRIEVENMNTGEVDEVVDKDSLVNHWVLVLEYDNKRKTQSDIDLMLDVYSMFEKPFKIGA